MSYLENLPSERPQERLECHPISDSAGPLLAFGGACW